MAVTSNKTVYAVWQDLTYNGMIKYGGLSGTQNDEAEVVQTTIGETSANDAIRTSIADRRTLMGPFSSMPIPPYGSWTGFLNLYRLTFLRRPPMAFA